MVYIVYCSVIFEHYNIMILILNMVVGKVRTVHLDLLFRVFLEIFCV